MRRWNATIVAAAAAAVVLTGCGQLAPTVDPPTPPSGTESASPSPSATGSGTPTVSVTPSSSTSPSATPTASQTPTASASPSKGAGLVLSGKGVGSHKFGAAEAAVEKTLDSALGEPDESIQGASCELAGDSPWQRTVIYDSLAVMFTAKSSKKSAPRTLNSWSLTLGGKLPKVQLEDGIPLDLSFKELKAKYPKGKLTDTGLGDGSEVFTLPNGIRFVGVESPDMVMGGELNFCE